MIKKLEERTTLFVRDEIILTIAGLLGFQDFFYPLYISFINDTADGTARLGDFIDEFVAKGIQPHVEEKRLRSVLRAQTNAGKQTAQKFVREVDDLFGTLQVSVADVEISPLLQEAVRNAKVVRLKRFRFLLAAVAIWFAFLAQAGPSGSGSMGKEK